MWRSQKRKYFPQCLQLIQILFTSRLVHTYNNCMQKVFFTMTKLSIFPKRHQSQFRSWGSWNRYQFSKLFVATTFNFLTSRYSASWIFHIQVTLLLYTCIRAPFYILMLIGLVNSIIFEILLHVKGQCIQG